MTSPELFRFVQLRRPDPAARPDLPLPPPGDALAEVLNFQQSVPDSAIETIRTRDRRHAVQLSHWLLERLPAGVREVAGTVRDARRWAATTETLTLQALRTRLGHPAVLANAPDFTDLTGRAAGVVVLDRWLGQSRSPGGQRASALLRGIVIIRLAASTVDGGYLVRDVLAGTTIELPDLRPGPQQPSPKGAALHDARDLMPRLRTRAKAMGLGEDPNLEQMNAVDWSELSPAVQGFIATAQQLGIPTSAALSTVDNVLATELSTDLDLTPILVPSGQTPFPVPLPPPSLPVLDARARVLGRGDLMLVRTTHLRYDLAEIAYVENVLKSEVRGRRTVIDTATSEKIVETSDLFSETSQELTTTERSSLQQTAQTANSSTTNLSAGVSIAGGLGPVSVGLDVDASHSTTDSSSNSTATAYAKDVTNRASDTMRSQSSTSTTTTERSRFTETDRHDFDNSAGADHIRGVYRFLDKVDQAQVYNYGQRLMLEFVVPEPAAQHVYLATTTASTSAPVPPPPLDIRPTDITEHNYVTLGQPYDTVGLTRPPDEELAVAATFSVNPAVPLVYPPPDDKKKDEAPPVPDYGNDVLTGSMKIPDGYAAVRVTATVVYGGSYSFGPPPVDPPNLPGYNPGFPPVMIGVGGQRLTVHFNDRDPNLSGTESHTIQLQGPFTGDLPVVIGGQQRDGWAVALRAVCERTAEARADWQLKTYQAIQSAYLSKQSAYQSAAAVAAVQQGYAELTPSEVNQQVQRDELKRGCQTILTGQDFDLFGSVLLPAGEIPRIDVEESWVEADVIQFFEDVFDWDLMAYLFYPYQWAGRLRWAELLSRTSPDPLHQAFLRAGAARVVVPVRDGYERAVADYLKDGTVPQWGPRPWRGRPTGYPPVDVLVAEGDQQPGDEVPIGDPWEVVTPTTLVYLQEDAELNPTT